MPVYIPVLLFVGTIILVMKKDLNEKNIVVSCSFVIIVMYLYNQFGGNVFNLSGQFLFYSSFFLLGYILKDIVISMKKLVIFEVLNIVLIWYLGGVLDINVLNLQKAKFTHSIIYVLASMIFIILTIYVRPFLKDNNFYWIQHIGKNALYYYFSQGIASSLIYYWVNKAVSNQMNAIVTAIIAAFINFIITTILAETYRMIYENVDKVVRNLYSRPTER